MEESERQTYGEQSFNGNLTSQFDRACQQLKGVFLAENTESGGDWYLTLSRNTRSKEPNHVS